MSFVSEDRRSHVSVLLLVALLWLAGCSSSSDSSAANPSTSTTTTAAEPATTTSSPPTTEAPWANPPVELGAEDFNTLYRRLDDIRNQATGTLDLGLFDTASRHAAARERLESRIAEGRYLDWEDSGYVIDNVDVLHQPDENSVILVATDTRTGDFVYRDETTGEVVETKPGREQQTLNWLVTMQRDPEGVWHITSDTVLFNDVAARIASGTRSIVDTGKIGDSTISAHFFGDDYCVLHHDPAAVGCFGPERYELATADPDQVAVQFRLWDIDDSTLFFVLTSNTTKVVIEDSIIPHTVIRSGTPRERIVVSALSGVDADATYLLRRYGAELYTGPVRPE